MSPDSALYALASVPMFASRPFLAAFVTAAIARWGRELPYFGELDTVLALATTPEWFQSGWTIAVLFALAVAELAAAKQPEIRAALEDVDAFVKSAVAALVALAVLDADTSRTIDAVRGAGWLGSGGWAGAIAVLTWRVARWRQSLVEGIAEIDDGDDVGVQSTLHWVETSWTAGGLLFVVLLPLLAVVFALLTALALWWLARRAQRRELLQRQPCAACASPVLPHAIACSKCRVPLAAPRAVGIFGTAKRAPAGDLSQHRLRLLARKRCPLCAHRLARRTARQTCPECATVTFASRADFERYLAAVQKRLPTTLLVCLAFSAVPVVGVIPGVVYYRLTLVSGLRGYVPPVRGCLARVATRVLGLFVLALQPIPVLGALILPLLCLIAFLVYRRALTGHAASELERLPPATLPAT